MRHLVRIWGNIGDAICAEPFVRELIARNPNDHVAIQSMAPTLYQTYPGVAEVYHLDEVVVRKRYDRYWFARPDWHSHISAYFEKYKEYRVSYQPPRLYLPRVDISEFSISWRRPVICIAAAPSNPIRAWPMERWVELVRRLNERYTTVQLGQGEPPIDGVTHCLVNRTTLIETAEILRRARLLVSIDSGISHLATAVGRRSIVLYGPVDPAIRAYAGYTIPVTAGKCTACWPTYRGLKQCPQGHHSCMDIEVDTVLDAILKEIGI